MVDALRLVLIACVCAAALLGAVGKAFGWFGPPADGGVPGRATVDRPPAADDVLGQIVTAIARRPARVACDYPAGREAAGFVRFVDGRPEDVAHLAVDVCHELRNFLVPVTGADVACIERNDGPCSMAVLRTIRAVHVIAHESYHVAGVKDEAAADCYALQAFGWVARRLGSPRPFSRSLLRYYWRHYAPIRMPPGEYWSDQCRSGGELDLRDDDVEPPWAA